MKQVALLIICLTLFSSFYSQTNDSPLSAYKWKGKKTELTDGYVILKSDKRLDGKISLIGDVSNVTHVNYVGDGKDIELPVAALKNYGVVSASGETVQVKRVPLPASTKDLFQWRTVNEAEGNVTENTKPRNGYVILMDGNRLDGEIQLKRKNGHFNQIKLKTESDKHKFKPSDVQDYGLALTIDELTKGGEKTYKDEAKNFHEGKVALNNGSEKIGLVAFTEKYHTTIGDTYGDVMFADNKDAIIKTFKDSEVKFVTQMIDGDEVKYTLFEGGFVSTAEMADAEYADVFKMLNPGSVTMKSGTILNGNISRIDDYKLNYQDADGVFKEIGSAEISRVDITVNDEPKALINVEDHLIEEIFSGNTFLTYINPNPTHVNEFATKMAKGAMGMGTTVAAAAASNKMDKNDGVESDLDSVIMNSSTEKLKEINNALYASVGVTDHEGYQGSSAPDFLKQRESAISVAIAGREAANSGFKVYYKETVVLNKKTNEKFILYNHKSTADDQLEGLLMGCYTFLSLEKGEQKEYYKLKNIKETVKMLDECY
jgi:hypothetical protein